MLPASQVTPFLKAILDEAHGLLQRQAGGQQLLVQVAGVDALLEVLDDERRQGLAEGLDARGGARPPRP
jgi:hypothetical protein